MRFISGGGIHLEKQLDTFQGTVELLISAPYDPDTLYWRVEETRDSNQNLLYREYSANDREYVFRHYEDGRDSIFTWNDDTPSYAQGGTIQFYALGSTTSCNDVSKAWVSMPQPAGVTDAERRSSCRSDSNCQWVNYTVD